MIEYTLRECLASGVGAQVLVEPERLCYRQVPLENDSVVVFNGVKDVSSAFVESSEYTAHDVLRCSDFSQEDWLLETRFCRELTGETCVSGGWTDLVGSSVDGVGVQRCIPERVAHAALLLEREWP